jgi:hypothetical protein
MQGVGETVEMARLRRMFARDEATSSSTLAPGLYARADPDFSSFLWIVPDRKGFSIEWRDAYDGAWLRGRGVVEEVAEASTDGSLHWELYLTGDFVVSVPAHAMPSEGLECYDDKALEQLLQRLWKVGPPRHAPSGTSTGKRSSRKGAASSRGKAGLAPPPPPPPPVQVELSSQTYTWSFDLALPEGMQVAEAKEWLAEAVAAASTERPSLVQRLASPDFPFVADDELEGTEEGSQTDEDAGEGESLSSRASSSNLSDGKVPTGAKKRAAAAKGGRKKGGGGGGGGGGTAKGPLSSRRSSSPSAARRKSASTSASGMVSVQVLT